MASSGTINNTFRTGYAIRITWNVTSQDITNNTSTVTANVQLVSLGSAYTIISSASKSGTLTVNGVKYSFNFTAALSANQVKTIYTKTGIVVNHNSDGSKSCAFSCTADIAVTLSGTYYGTVSASGTGTFDTIARASTISSVTSTVDVNGTNACTVNISRKASGFTHTVVWKIGSYSKTTTGVGTSTSYAIPVTWLNAIPDATSGTATVQVTTYSGSTQIGSTASTTFKITAPSTVVPTISSIIVTDANAAYVTQFGTLVRNKSSAKITITASGLYGSTIKSYKTVIDGNTYTGATPTTSILTNSGNISASVTVTDSRGRTTTTTKAITVAAYQSPTITKFTAIRSDSKGVANYEGAYALITTNLSVASVNSKNTSSYVIKYKKTSESTWKELVKGTAYTYSNSIITGAVFDVNYSYDVTVEVTDYFSTVTKTVEIPTAYTLIDFNSSGHGISIGKVSEKDALEINMDIYDKYDTKISNGVSGYGDPNTSYEELILTSGNAPTANMYYIRTVFEDAKSATAKKFQIAYPYSVKESIYYRQCFSSWSAWMEIPVV